MSFGDNLRTLINERGLTQKKLAEQFNIAPSTLGSYVQNVREPDFATLKSFANYFNVTIDYLLDNHVECSSSKPESELLRIFRSLSNEQKKICLEQCRVFVQYNNKEKDSMEKSS